MRTLVMTIGFCIFAGPALAGDTTAIPDSRLQDQSDANYIALVLSSGKESGYSPEQIVSGLKRHRQEWRARMIDAGFAVEQGEGS